MPVPGIWEMNGFGKPIYVNTGYDGVISSKVILQLFPKLTITLAHTVVKLQFLLPGTEKKYMPNFRFCNF